MRAHEFISETQERRPEISLRHLNHLKHINRARAASLARQAALKRTMYASPAREQAWVSAYQRSASKPTGHNSVSDLDGGNELRRLSMNDRFGSQAVIPNSVRNVRSWGQSRSRFRATGGLLLANMRHPLRVGDTNHHAISQATASLWQTGLAQTVHQ